MIQHLVKSMTDCEHLLDGKITYGFHFIFSNHFEIQLNRGIIFNSNHFFQVENIYKQLPQIRER